MSLSPVDRLFLRVRSEPFFWRFTLFTRILLAAAFLPTGMIKLLGHRFTLLGPDNPIGAFFEAMYQTGFYWNFLGLSQVVAAVLLLVPRWAHLGALLFVPIATNIFLITVSVGFSGTPWVTGPMLLASLYLCAWDWHRHRSIWTAAPWPQGVAVPTSPLDRWERAGFFSFAGAILVVFSLLRWSSPPGLVAAALCLGVASGLLTLSRFLLLRLRGRHVLTDTV